MATKTIYENPSITDTIVFTLPCPSQQPPTGIVKNGFNGCYGQNPYKVNNVVIYYVERDFLGTNYGKYDQTIYNNILAAQSDEATAAACANPTPENIQAANIIQTKLNSSSKTYTYYYNDRDPVLVLGSNDYPAWICDDVGNAFIDIVATDANGVPYPLDSNGNPISSTFQYTWRPKGGVRGGDYFICWTWTPLPAGDILSAHWPFFLTGDESINTAIPTHIVPPEKYNTLLERYLPEMYKFQISNGDLTPIVIDYLNRAVADGFTFIENMANEIIDLFDANALHETLLVYLANLFNIKLKSSDPTLWRRQIKEAVPMFKTKGSLPGMKTAFSQAGMNLDKLTRLWQIVSKYNWQESFTVTVDDDLVWPLYQNNVIGTNFQVSVRSKGTSAYNSVPQNSVNIIDNYGEVTMAWAGEPLNVGDIVLLKYQYQNYPSDYEHQLDDYIMEFCPLGDLRDEAPLDPPKGWTPYPPKNWNVRVVEEDDPLFQVLIPVRNPYHDWIVFGQVRTEFGYSENIYNMDEYNGSTRDSLDPCDIDKSFVDPCGQCAGSMFNIDVSVEELSDNRISEIKDIIKENAPFHAQMHTLNLMGTVNELVMPPQEYIQTLVSQSIYEFVISGEQNPFFNRAVINGLSSWALLRNQLATENTIATGTGVMNNSVVRVVCPDSIFDGIEIIEKSHILEILEPSPNAGEYMVANLNGHIADISTYVHEQPLNESMFTFRLSNITYQRMSTQITQCNIFKFSDPKASFNTLSVNQKGTWSITLPSGTYPIEGFLPDGTLILTDNGTLSASSGLTYTILSEVGHPMLNGRTGAIAVEIRALVDFKEIMDISPYISIGNFIYYNGTEYPIIGFDSTGINPYISGYQDGNASGVRTYVRQRVINETIGYFGYGGTVLNTAPTDYETLYGVLDGFNANNTQYQLLTAPSLNAGHAVNYATGADGFPDNSNFTGNYMVKITYENRDHYYKIEQFNKNRLTLSGVNLPWGSLKTSGQQVQYSILYFQKTAVDSHWVVFDQLDRRGKDPVEREVQMGMSSNVAIVALSNPNEKGTGIEENIAQEESISFEIVYADGTTKKGVL